MSRKVTTKSRSEIMKESWKRRKAAQALAEAPAETIAEAITQPAADTIHEVHPKKRGRKPKTKPGMATWTSLGSSPTNWGDVFAQQPPAPLGTLMKAIKDQGYDVVITLAKTPEDYQRIGKAFYDLIRSL